MEGSRVLACDCRRNTFTSCHMMIIAHRGASGSAPENTMVAFRRAIELGADWLELDVCASRDGEVVVFHDDKLDRTTNGKGRVRDHTLAELKRFDAGSSFDSGFAGEKIPSLKEVITLARTNRVGLLVEMKAGSHLGHGFEQKVTTQLAGQEMLGNSFMMSFDHAAVGRAKRIQPRVRTLLIVGRPMGARKLVKTIRAHDANGVTMNASHVSRSLVHSLQAEGLLVLVWTVNTVRQMRKFMGLGVDGITTNFPKRLAQLVHKAEQE